MGSAPGADGQGRELLQVSDRHQERPSAREGERYMTYVVIIIITTTTIISIITIDITHDIYIYIYIYTCVQRAGVSDSRQERPSERGNNKHTTTIVVIIIIIVIIIITIIM